MGFFEQFPYTNFHTINLDWIIKNVRICLDKIDTLNSDIKSLETYVKDYFKNLNVQDEINNKLEEMAESGELANIITDYVRLHGLNCFDTVSDMVMSDTLADGSYAKTFGFHTFNDGGGACYRIRRVTNTDNVNGCNVIGLNNPELIAILADDDLNIKKYGADGTGNLDCTNAFVSAIANAKNKTIYIPSGVFKIDSEITGSDFSLIGDGQQNTFLLFNGTNGFVISQTEVGPSKQSACITVRDITLAQDGAAVGTALTINGALPADRWTLAPIIENVRISSYSAGHLEAGWLNGIVIKDCNGVVINNCSITGCILNGEPNYVGAGIEFKFENEPRATDFLISSCFITLFDFAIATGGVFEGLNVDNSRIVGCATGVYCYANAEYPLVSVEQTHFNCSKYCIHVSNAKEIQILGCNLYNQIVETGNCWGIYLYNVSHFNISNNSVNNLSAKNMFGIQLESSCRYGFINHNEIRNQGVGTVAAPISLGVETQYIKCDSNMIYNGTVSNQGNNNVVVEFTVL
ncbi:MAG: hypothetical protein IJX16_01820 [Clostridia bacterium]|nr:hypothetical protein [Clostridia bacterium]